MSDNDIKRSHRFPLRCFDFGSWPFVFCRSLQNLFLIFEGIIETANAALPCVRPAPIDNSSS